MDNGSCVESVHPDYWFDPPNDKAHSIALYLCHVCPVRQQCADYATTNNIQDGIWGGLTPQQRRHHKHRGIA